MKKLKPSEIRKKYLYFFVENGHIVETGTHREQIAKQGAYEHLYSIENL